MGYTAPIERFPLIISIAASVVLTIVAVLLIGAGGLVVLTATGVIGLVLLIEEDLAGRPGASAQGDGGRRAPRA